MIWGLQPAAAVCRAQEFVGPDSDTGQLAGLIIVLTCVPLFAAILRVPFSIIAPVIMVICAVGAYTINNAMFDIWLMVMFGVTASSINCPFAGADGAGARAGDMAESRSGRRCSCPVKPDLLSNPPCW